MYARIREVHVLVAPLVQLEPALDEPRPHDLALVRHIDVVILHLARRQTEGRVARAGDAHAVEQPHSPVHLQAEIGDAAGLDAAERLDPAGVDVGAELVRGAGLPVGADALEVQRRELALDLVLEREVELDRLARLAVAQGGAGLAEVVVAVVAEEDDLAADLRLEPPRRGDLGVEVAPGEEAARLLAEADDGGGSHGFVVASARDSPGPSAAWSTRLKPTHAAQPIRLYQR